MFPTLSQIAFIFLRSCLVSVKNTFLEFLFISSGFMRFHFTDPFEKI